MPRVVWITILVICWSCHTTAQQTRGMLPIIEGNTAFKTGGEKVFLLGETDPTVVLSAGTVVSFEAWVGQLAPLSFQVWRPRSNDQYELVGQVRVPDDALRIGYFNFTLDPSERFNVADGDALAFYAHTRVIPLSASFNINSKIKQLLTIDGVYTVGDVETFDDIPYPYSFAFAVSYIDIVPTTQTSTVQLATTTILATQPPVAREPPAQPSTTTEPPAQPSTTREPPTQPSTTTKPPAQPSTTREPATQSSTTREPPAQPTTTKEPEKDLTNTEEPQTPPPTTKEPAIQPTTTVTPVTIPQTTSQSVKQSPNTEEPATPPPTAQDSNAKSLKNQSEEIIVEFGNPRVSGLNTQVAANQAWFLTSESLVAGTVNRFEFRSATNLDIDQSDPMEVRMQIWRPLSGAENRYMLVGEERVAVRQTNLLHTVYPSTDGGIQVQDGDHLGFTELSQTGVIARNTDFNNPRSKTRMYDFYNDGNGTAPLLFGNYMFGYSQSHLLFSIAVFIAESTKTNYNDEENIVKYDNKTTSLGAVAEIGCRSMDNNGTQRRITIIKLGTSEVPNRAIFDSNDQTLTSQENLTIVADKYEINPMSGLYILNVELSDAGRYRCLEFDGENVTSERIVNLAVTAISCDFEIDNCGLELNNDGFKWERHRGETETGGTGPNGDHTSGDGYYLYTDVSPPAEYKDKTRAVLGVKGQNITEDGKLKFFYHAYGDDVGAFNVLLNSSGQEVSLFDVSGPQDSSNWRYGEVDISFKLVQNDLDIIFEVTRGRSWKGDVAIDDVTLIFGEHHSSHTASKVSPTTPPSPYIESGGGYWIHFTTSYLQGNNDATVTGMTLPGCLQACVQYSGFFCKSVDYVENTKECILSKTSHNDAGTIVRLQYHPFVDYYERIYDEPTSTPAPVVNTPARDDEPDFTTTPISDTPDTIVPDTSYESVTMLIMVTDTTIGRPAQNMTVSIYYNHQINGWTHIHTSLTDAMGKAGIVLNRGILKFGAYKAQLHSASYFSKFTPQQKSGFPYIEITWEVSSDLQPLYYIPVLVNPYSYTVHTADMMDLMQDPQSMFSL